MSRQNKYSLDVRQAISFAREYAQRLRHRLVGTEHLLLGILKLHDPLIEGVLNSLHANPARIAQALEFVVGRGNKAILSEPSLNAAARSTLMRAEQEALHVQSDSVGLEHLLLAILDEHDGVAVGVLESFGVASETARKTLATLLRSGRDELLLVVQYQTRYDTTPTLNQVSRDLTLAALQNELDPMIGREEELERTMQILSRRSKNNPALIGPAGVGKTAIAEGLAQRIVCGQVPETLLMCRVVALDVGMLTVGTRFRGDFEDRLKMIMQEIVSSPGMIVVIDELHALVHSGVAEGSIDAANLFKPMLARGDFRCIGATTLDEYRKTIESDPALERRFQPVQVFETSAKETLEILRGLRSRYEDFHQVSISEEALNAAVRMSSRYIQNRYLPDKALDLVDEAASYMCVQLSMAPDSVHQLRNRLIAVQREKDYAIAQRDFSLASHLLKSERQLRQDLWLEESIWHAGQRQQRPTVHAQEIAHVVARWTGIPVMQILEDEMLRLLNLEQALHERVVGQDEAVQAVARAVRRSRADIRDQRRPVGSFVFAGPAGVGKTALARALAAVLFGDENALLEFDMSEFMESHHISRLIGSPPGYVGYDQAGQLTEAVRRSPYSIVLFDEIEKAHPQVLDILLQILEDGVLTDARGQKVDFKHTLIILTSNAGIGSSAHNAMAFARNTRNQQEASADDLDRLRAYTLPALKASLRPELLNRVDEIVVFHPLLMEHLHKIVDLMIAQVQQRMAERSIALEVTTAARQSLVEYEYDPAYGARALRRTVQHLLEDMLAEAILQGVIIMGDVVQVDAVDGKLCKHIMAQGLNSLSVSATGPDCGAA
ncbi:MAG TPA: ATP-dependent Clp protease ATP-binding subunit [Ktedonobacteraceae bacterium]|nr:ATP-dependent Clp protease ATP-binding subunit [Ktedonobacteraceae bacterium]